MKVLLWQKTNCTKNIRGIINWHTYFYVWLCTSANVTLCPCNTNVTLYAFINMAPKQPCSKKKKKKNSLDMGGNAAHLHTREVWNMSTRYNTAHYESYYHGPWLVISIIFKMGLDRVHTIPWRLGWQSFYITIHFRGTGALFIYFFTQASHFKFILIESVWSTSLITIIM